MALNNTQGDFSKFTKSKIIFHRMSRKSANLNSQNCSINDISTINLKRLI